MARPSKRFQKQAAMFKEHGGLLRTSVAMQLGIHPRDLYAMRDAGILEPVSRGLYRLSRLPPAANPDLSTVGLKISQGVICLISALAFHEITTQVPHEVYVALPQGSEKPKLDHPPTRFVWISEPAFSEGIETHKADGVPIRVYAPEKTVADCFKFRNRIGLDVAIEALKLCREKKRSRPDLLLKYAKICRVDRVMKPYLQAIL